MNKIIYLSALHIGHRDLGKRFSCTVDNIIFDKGDTRDEAGRYVKACARRVVYLHHHPFDPIPLHQLKDTGGLRNVLQRHKIDALLYGNNHLGRARNGKWLIPRCYDANF